MTIDRFDGTKYRFLSNFWPAPVFFEGDEYPTVEHAYQAAKTLDPFSRNQIRMTPSPYKAKAMGREVICRPNWENIKYSVMEDLVRQKFGHQELREKLLATGEEWLEEGNTWGDTYWGTVKGVGANNLGRILMYVRRYYSGNFVEA